MLTLTQQAIIKGLLTTGMTGLSKSAGGDVGPFRGTPNEPPRWVFTNDVTTPRLSAPIGTTAKSGLSSLLKGKSLAAIIAAALAGVGTGTAINRSARAKEVADAIEQEKYRKSDLAYQKNLALEKERQHKDEQEQFSRQEEAAKKRQMGHNLNVGLGTVGGGALGGGLGYAMSDPENQLRNAALGTVGGGLAGGIGAHYLDKYMNS